MALSDTDIMQAIKKGKIKIVPFKKDQLGPGSIDLTLSNEWYFFKKKYIGKKVDLSRVSYKDAFEKHIANSIILKPYEMCLGKTVEKITLSSDIMGRLEGRSRYARMGLSIHITAAIVQPGSSNHQVLEIVNLAPFSVKLRKGMRVSQIVFDELNLPTSKPYAKYGSIARVQ